MVRWCLAVVKAKGGVVVGRAAKIEQWRLVLQIGMVRWRRSSAVRALGSPGSVCGRRLVWTKLAVTCAASATLQTRGSGSRCTAAQHKATTWGTDVMSRRVARLVDRIREMRKHLVEQANMVARWVVVEQGGKGGSALTAGGSWVRKEGEWWRRGQGELEGAAASAPFIASGG
jgi:hypothetical protein